MNKKRQIKKPSLRFDRKLILNRWMLRQFEVDEFKTLGERIDSQDYEGFDNENRTQFYNILTSTLPFKEAKLSQAQLLEYDQNIVRHWKRITESRNRTGQVLLPKYFQYLALLFVEVYLDHYFHDREGLLAGLNAEVEAHNLEHGGNEADIIDKYTMADLNKLAIWCATGSGKTLLMHVNVLQYRHYLAKHGKIENLNRTILLTPNEGLTNQHLEEFQLSGMEAEPFDKAGNSIFTGQAVEIIEVTKLADEAKVKTVAVEAFEGNNLVLVDEGHRGTSGKEQGAWMDRRKQLCEEGFSFEYSATFGQAVKASNNKSLTMLYAKCILFDYSYKYFHGDGYGKDYRILNLEDDAQERELHKYLTACLLTFYQQLKLFTDRGGDFRKYLIEKPLWVFVGGSVNAVRSQRGRQVSDVVEVLLFFSKFMRGKADSIKFIDGFVKGEPVLLDKKQANLFQNKFGYLARTGLDAAAIFQDIERVLFNAATGGALHVDLLKGSDGELTLSMGADNEPFGVINVGDAKKLFDLCDRQDELICSERDFSASYFRAINNPNSKINVLIGSKKFTEGWSSWRVSTMGLLNVGKSEGSMVIQLFGRGVRLKGYEFSLKRSRIVTPTSGPKDIGTLETLNIFGVRADYMRQFRDYLEEEGMPTERNLEEIILPIVAMDGLSKKRLKMVRLKEGVDYKRHGRVPTLATPDAAFLRRNRVEIDWYPRIRAMSSGRGGEVAVAVSRHQDWLQDRHIALLDIDRIFFELVRLKNERAWYNFNLTATSIRDLLHRTDWYDLYIPKEEMEGRSFAQVRVWQEIATALLKKYCERFYKWQKATYENDKMELKELTPDDPNFAMEYRFLIEESAEEIIRKVKELKEEIAAGTFRKWTFQGVTSVYFGKNLYQPLLHVQNTRVEVRPVTLNDGEKQFVEDLHAYCEKYKALFANKELYLLRNRSRGGGIGFFEAGNFYPDFIVWIVEGNHQYITFVDPKGIRNLEGLQDPKIKFHETIKGLEDRLGDDAVTMNSFIISVTPSQQVLWWTANISREELEAHNVLFQTEDRDHYIRKLIQGSMAQAIS